MDSELLSRLEALANRSNQRSNVARLRDIFDHVEQLLQRGFSREDVLAELNAGGLDMSKASFKSALQRIRAERASNSKTPKLNAFNGRTTCPHCGSALDDQKVSEKPVAGNSGLAEPVAPATTEPETDMNGTADQERPILLSDAFLRGQRRMKEQGQL